MSSVPQKQVLYLIVCAAPPAQQMHEYIPVLQEAGWDVLRDCYAASDPLD